MPEYTKLQNMLSGHSRCWLITGVAGFIGSNLLESLLKAGQRVVGLDNFITGHQRNLDEVKQEVTPEQWAGFSFLQGDIRDLNTCMRACSGCDYVLHQAALGSVPRSIKDPLLTHSHNIDGFLNILVASRDMGVKRFIYASSSTVYGDHTGLPKVENVIGKPLAPYAVSKYVNELYADVFARNYGVASIGLRYFNVFGKRQDPHSVYAAVIPKWIAGMVRNEPVAIYGDGETSRDFCYIDNVVQINILAALSENKEASNQVYNVAVGERTTLNELYHHIHTNLLPRYPKLKDIKPIYQEFRAGDIRHSLADISKAKHLLGYTPAYRVKEGLQLAMDWYISNAMDAVVDMN